MQKLPEKAGAIDLRRLEEIVVDLTEESAHEIDPENLASRDVRQDQDPVGVDQGQALNPDKSRDQH
ncbi:MAG: hypothetical protein GHCLOJNM_04693 [bacterium]|nr:hypothetical protein [bacterium]